MECKCTNCGNTINFYNKDKGAKQHENYSICKEN